MTGSLFAASRPRGRGTASYAGDPGMKPCLLFAGLLLLCTARVRADVRLPAVFGDHMVLQRGMKIPVWGWADPGEHVTVSVGARTGTAVTDESGQWRLTLDALDDSDNTPTAMTVKGRQTITLGDVLVGEVWLCSGQSNMQLQVKAAAKGRQETADASHPTIRLFQVNHSARSVEQDDVSGHWVVCEPKSAADFSAAGYYFGRDLQAGIKVPIGLIHSSWGGTLAEAWTAPESLATDPILTPILQHYQNGLKDWTPRMAKYHQQYAAWAERAFPKDPGNTGFEQGWAKPEFDDSAWPAAVIPIHWEEIPTINVVGMVWFRKVIEIPPAWQGKELTLNLGAIDDCDISYFDGAEVGRTWIDVSDSYSVNRHYPVPAKLARAGKHVVALRAFNTTWSGAISGPARVMSIAPAVQDQAEKPIEKPISLAGEWKYQLEHKLQQNWNPPPVPDAPVGPDNPAAPSNLFNAMIRPIMPFAIKGCIWYQGESNGGRGYQYRKLLPAMITGWRNRWGEGDFPFLIVQLPNYGNPSNDPVSKEPWPDVREAQWLTTRAIPNCEMAVTIDIGEKQIHPMNKQDVGKRLALLAEETVYRQKVEGCGPVLESSTIQGSRVTLHFSHIADGLIAKPGTDHIGGFAIAGSDRHFVWADAEISGDNVIVSSSKIQAPAAVRYLWSNCPSASLYNTAGLPAGPFRTDDWPVVSAQAR